MNVVDINISRSYRVYIGNGLIKDIGKYLETNKYGKYFLLTDENVNNLYGDEMGSYLKKDGKEVIKYIIPPGESSKSLYMVEKILEFMAQNQISRSDLLLAFGGGVVGDLGGFLAGIYQRGIDHIQIPTTILSAVDSSVGGKTGINLRSGKNLAGLFKQPSGVVCDPDLFKSLPSQEFKSGVAEIIKYSILFDRDLFERLGEGLNPDSLDLGEIIEKCLVMKRDIVLEDEYDYGKRHLLNLGHTMGHSIEALSQYKINHGYGVAMGMGIMARACRAKGICSSETANSIIKLLEVNGLPTDTDYSAKDLIKFARADKKSAGDFINIITIKDIGTCEIMRVDFNQLEKLIEIGVGGR